MSSHADTTRKQRQRILGAIQRSGRLSAADDLEALLDELALSRNLYDELFFQTEQLRDDRDALCSQVTKKHAENQRLREALEEIARSIYPVERRCVMLARDALAAVVEE